MKTISPAILFSTLIALAMAALAAVITSDNPASLATVQGLVSWAEGPWGIGVATCALLVGGAVGVAHCGPAAAFLGIGIAAVTNWGPTLVLNAMLLANPGAAATVSGAAIPAVAETVATAPAAAPR